MPTLIFRCPLTGYNVQGYFAEEPQAGPGAEQVFVSLRCTACGRTHLVDPASRAVLGAGPAPTA
jgi:hypothetical protein